MSDFANLELERPLHGVLVARLNRPDRLNVLNFAMFDELRDLRHQVETDSEVRALIPTGVVEGFAPGSISTTLAGLAG